MKKSKKPPVNKWLLCWNVENPREFSPKNDEAPPYFFAYLNEEGDWWMSIDDSVNEECGEPEYWMEI